MGNRQLTDTKNLQITNNFNMKRRSYIYEEIVEFLVKRNLMNKQFLAAVIEIPEREKVIKSFLYKHGNINYKKIWTLYFTRVEGTKPVEFNVDLELLAVYEKKFGLKLTE
jgi:hypothetical protein